MGSLPREALLEAPELSLSWLSDSCDLKKGSPKLRFPRHRESLEDSTSDFLKRDYLYSVHPNNLPSFKLP